MIPTNRVSGTPPATKQLPLNSFKGVNIALTPTQIGDTQSPDMLNMILDDRGALDKRNGFQKYIETLGNQEIKGMWIYKGNILYAQNQKLYKITGNTPLEIFTGLSNNDVFGFVFNEKFYFMDGAEYRSYDNSIVKAVEGYAPVVMTGTASGATGSGTLLEPFNLLTGWFRQIYSANGSDTAFKLILNGLDADKVTAIVNEVPKVEGTDFTVNRQTGIVTFTAAPAKGDNNVEIKAKKTVAGDRDKITKCIFGIIYGGEQDTRVYVTGSANNIDYGSDVLNAEYFPTNGDFTVGDSSEKITGYAKQFGSLVIFKENEIYQRTIQIINGAKQTNQILLNSGVGCINRKTVQLIENSPVFLTKNGVYQIIGTNVRDERNVFHISEPIDKNASPLVIGISGLLQDGNLDKLTSFDWDSKYFLFNTITGKTWIYDYRYKEWFIWDNCKFTCAVEYNGNIVAGTTDGKILTYGSGFKSYQDDGQPINSHWISKVFWFDTFTQYKLINRLFSTLKPATRASAEIYIRSDRQSQWELVDENFINLLSYSFMNYSQFSYGANSFPQTVRNKVKQKKVSEIQIKLVNTKINSSLGIIDLTLELQFQGENKGR